MLHHLDQVMLVLAFFFGKGAEHAVGVADGGRLDPAPSSLGDACRRRRALIQGLEELGRSPGRRANADGFFYCDSEKSLWAKGLLQFVGTHVFFSGSDDRRRGSRLLAAREGSRGFIAIPLLFRVFCVVWLTRLLLYPIRTVLFSYVYTDVFLI